MAARWIQSYLAAWWRGHTWRRRLDKLPRGPEIKCFPPRQVRQMLWSAYVCVRTCVVKACRLLQRKRSFFFISTQERSCALRGAGERTWARAAYLCFYELLKIRLAWSNLTQLRPLCPQMQEMEREEGVIEKPPVRNLWSMAGSSTLPFTACLYQFRAQWAITPRLHLHPPLSHPERHCGVQSPDPVSSPHPCWRRPWLQHQCVAVLQRVFTKQHEQLCFKHAVG